MPAWKTAPLQVPPLTRCCTATAASRVLKGCGLSLRKAHELLNRIAAGDEVAVILPAVTSRKAVANQLRKLGVAVDWRQAPEVVDVRSVRAALGLTQGEFAARFALDLDTVQNWEQGRNRPDRIARIVLRIIERDARSVEEAVKEENS
jgi:DNA-binding transcriptional regulator YiaG